MFETAELGRKISKKEYKEREPILREQLLEVQGQLRKAPFPVIVLFAGVDGAGKGETANLLSEWMDPRQLVTRAYSQPSQEEEERPEFWRYWRDLPPKGHIGVFLSAWYSRPLLDRVHGDTRVQTFDDELDRIATFERTLAEDGALILKFWMHLGKKAQEKRFKNLEADPHQKWRVTKRDWKHWRMYDRFAATAEQIIMRTSTGEAPWAIIEGADERDRSLEVGRILLEGIQRHLARPVLERVAVPAKVDSGNGPATVLTRLDMGKCMERTEYRKQLEKYQARLNLLHRQARERKISTILVFEGWDAGGKGGAIRRINAALDARDFQVLAIAAPTDEERAQHYLWRFWRHLSRAGRVTTFDRSWYGRVLVERVEGFAAEEEWRRAYAEINDFEYQLTEYGIVLVKFWIHITRDEQERRFQAREETPYKRWKLTEEDWRNREKWDAYELAVHDMVERTSSRPAPWVLVEGNDKRYARIKVLKEVCRHWERALDSRKD
jgi:polyphosphate:AMP phosphotransferase